MAFVIFLPLCIIMVIVRGWPLILRLRRILRATEDEFVDADHSRWLSLVTMILLGSLIGGLIIGIDDIVDPYWLVLVGCFPADLYFAYWESRRPDPLVLPRAAPRTCVSPPPLYAPASSPRSPSPSEESVEMVDIGTIPTSESHRG